MQIHHQDSLLYVSVQSHKICALIILMLCLCSDGDGHIEMVIGYSDRRVRSYRWLDAGKDPSTGMLAGKFIPVENWQLAGQVISFFYLPFRS